MDKYAIALGMFDGVHIGHRAVLNSAVSSGFKSVAVTFESLPFKSGGILMTPETKKAALMDFGIDEVLFLDFNEVKDLTPTDFLDKLSLKYNLGKISCGFNYRFGKKALGDTAFLREYCRTRGIDFEEIPPVKKDGMLISSSLIKELLKEGETEEAAKLLTKPFSFTAKIEKGDQRGRTMGFPTANQVYPEKFARLKNGVYQTVVRIAGKDFDGVTNIGVRPTYPKDFITAETHILNCNGDFYSAKMETKIIKFLREEKKFDSLEELKEAILKNVNYVKENSKI